MVAFTSCDSKVIDKVTGREKREYIKVMKQVLLILQDDSYELEDCGDLL